MLHSSTRFAPFTQPPGTPFLCVTVIVDIRTINVALCDPPTKHTKRPQTVNLHVRGPAAYATVMQRQVQAKSKTSSIGKLVLRRNELLIRFRSRIQDPILQSSCCLA